MNMKVSRRKILSMAVALVLGYAVNSDAFRVDFDEDTWVDFTIRGQLIYYNLDERGTLNYGEENEKEIDYRQNYFELTEAEFYAKGEINPLIQFFTQWECYYKPLKLSGEERDNADRAFMKETGMNFLFAPEFKLRFGRIRLPVSRYHQRSDYKKMIPTDYFWRYDVHEVFRKALPTPLKLDQTALEIRQPGAVFFGDPFDGMLRYHIGLFNQANNDKNYEGLRYTARLAFTPTMLGFKPESSLKGTRGDSYLGEKDVLTIGVGYSKEEIWDDLDNEMYAGDVLFEKKYGSIVPNLGFGYIEAKETHRIDGNAEDSRFWWVQGQLLYDKVVGFGKPAIAARFETMQADKAYLNQDAEFDRLSVCLHYFIKGYNAWVSVGLDNVRYKDGAKDFVETENKEDSITDWNVAFEFMF